MPTEVWIRNPRYCIKECIEVRASDIVWDRGYLIKMDIDPTRFADLYFPPSMPYRQLIIGDDTQGALELRRGTSMGHPFKVHPLWEYGTDLLLLEQHLEQVGPGGRVVVTRTPVVSSGLGKMFMRVLRDLQAEYSDRIIHLHGLYSWRIMFGSGFKSVDIEPRVTAQKGKVVLPSGHEVTYETAQTMPQWMAAVGVQPADLAIPRNRCMFNIESARWAAKYFTSDYKFETRHRSPDDDGNMPSRVNSRIMTRNVVAKLGDKFVCDVCSLKTTCKYFRVGSVCSVPDSEGTELARYFKTRDSDQIIEGLGTLLAIQTQRLEEGRSAEKDDEKISPEVTKLINGLFDRGLRLAKLVNPELAAAGAPRLRLNVTQNNAHITAANPQALMAAVVNELESKGVRREDITPEMITELLDVPRTERQHAIEAVAVESHS